MNNPWLAVSETGSALDLKRPFPSKRAARAFAVGWVQQHPDDRLTVIARKSGNARLKVSVEDGEVQVSPCTTRKRRSPGTQPTSRNIQMIDEALRALGFNKTEAQKIRRAVIDVMVDALKRGESVQTPLGTFSVVPAPPERRRFNNLEHHRTGEWKIQEIFKNQKKRIKYRPNKKIFGNPKAIPIPPVPIRRAPAVAMNRWLAQNPHSRTVAIQSFWPFRNLRRRGW